MMKYEVFSRYRRMVVLCMFDLPVMTPQEAKAAADFRNDLLRNGFHMLQYSVYVRFCDSTQHAERISTRLDELFYGKGTVLTLSVTERQYAMMHISHGIKGRKARKPDGQLCLFGPPPGSDGAEEITEEDTDEESTKGTESESTEKEATKEKTENDKENGPKSDNLLFEI